MSAGKVKPKRKVRIHMRHKHLICSEAIQKLFNAKFAELSKKYPFTAVDKKDFHDFLVLTMIDHMGPILEAKIGNKRSTIYSRITFEPAGKEKVTGERLPAGETLGENQTDSPPIKVTEATSVPPEPQHDDIVDNNPIDMQITSPELDFHTKNENLT